MIKRFNFTERTSIPSKSIILMAGEQNGVVSFSISMSETVRASLPSEAGVYIDITDPPKHQRIAWGKVSTLRPLENKVIAGFTIADKMKFSVIVKQQDSARLLATSSEITPTSINENQGPKNLLIGVSEKEMNAAFQVEYSIDNKLDQPAILYVNKRIGKLRMQASPVFGAYVLPTVVREVFSTILLNGDPLGEDIDTDMNYSLWLRFANTFAQSERPVVPDQPEDDEIDDYRMQSLKWIEMVVEEFSKRNGFVDKLLELMKAEEEES